MNFCINCGALRLADAKFCGQCGNAFAIQVEPTPPWPEREEAQKALDGWVSDYRPIEFRDYSSDDSPDVLPRGWELERIWTTLWNWDSESEYLVSGFYPCEDARGYFLTANPAIQGDENREWLTYMEWGST